MHMRMTTRQIERMIVYEDEELLVVHKPPFLAVETKNIRQQDLVSLLTNRRAANGERGGIYVIHRLDQPVEGLLVLAKTREAAAALGRELTGSGFSKEYYAVVWGITESSGTLVHTLQRDGRTNTSAVVVGAAADGAKEASLSYERLAVKDEKSLLRIALDTGRHHQIRVQFAAVGHPLVGDVKYGGQQPSGDGQPLALCSSRLCFTHPKSGEPMEFCAVPTGGGFAEFASELHS